MTACHPTNAKSKDMGTRGDRSILFILKLHFSRSVNIRKLSDTVDQKIRLLLIDLRLYRLLYTVSFHSAKETKVDDDDFLPMKPLSLLPQRVKKRKSNTRVHKLPNLASLYIVFDK